MAVTKETRDAIRRNEKELDAKVKSGAEDFFEENRKRIENRHQTNVQLITELKELVNRHPEQRFGQIICNYFISKDERTFFYEEPDITLTRVSETNKFEEIKDRQNYGK